MYLQSILRYRIDMKNLKYIRIIIYIVILVLLCILKFTNRSNFGECYINKNFGLLCPSCGITRATESLLNFNFSLAMTYNSFYTLVLLPVFLIFLIDDITCMITKKRSFVDIILGE